MKNSYAYLRCNIKSRLPLKKVINQLIIFAFLLAGTLTNIVLAEPCRGRANSKIIIPHNSNKVIIKEIVKKPQEYYRDQRGSKRKAKRRDDVILFIDDYDYYDDIVLFSSSHGYADDVIIIADN